MYILSKSAHLLKSPANAAHLAKSIKQYRSGKSEPLKESLAGFWSRRIDDSHRLVYAVDKEQLTIISCHYHFER
ncbi:Txe/YoeB family addiction module toxin [Pseudohongiella nitratireducens]|uniref:Txe/YoeB family addiction module toxin n=1 Tax=Pseudohongiella nitratireducens TaxID=1768907 RepID=UPI003C6E46D7